MPSSPFVEPCPECGADTWLFDAARDEEVCQACGLVRFAHTSHGATPSDADRHGPRRLRAVEKRTLQISGSQQRLQDAVRESARIAEALGCPPDIAARAGHVLGRARKAGLTQGRDLDAMAAAAVLASCRLLFLTRTSAEVAAASRIAEGAVQHAYKALVTGLRLPVPAMTAREYLGQLTSKLGLPASLIAPAQARLGDICGTARAAGKTPIGWAAAALVLAARDVGIAMSVNAAAKAAGVSGSTVAARIEDLLDG